MYKVSEVAKQCGVSATSIYTGLKELGERYYTKVDGTMYVSEEGLQYFLERYETSKPYSSQQQQLHQEKLLEMMRDELDLLQRQLEKKDDQLAEKDHQLNEKDYQLAEKDRQISEKDKQIAEQTHQVSQLIDQSRNFQLMLKGMQAKSLPASSEVKEVSSAVAEGGKEIPVQDHTGKPANPVVRRRRPVKPPVKANPLFSWFRKL